MSNATSVAAHLDPRIVMRSARAGLVVSTTRGKVVVIHNCGHCNESPRVEAFVPQQG
jgi:hypothetical protein